MADGRTTNAITTTAVATKKLRFASTLFLRLVYAGFTLFPRYYDVITIMKR